ncbi:rab11 family-interacting protein 1 isoform X2 [Bombina bombina]|uniref:rab11 family-interacting protein 1 isoform X2 n=1 Tax=Bombina bombina TaxID=8345 RepID=UPI00235AF4C2|nr:rab11 family-interacting protein 1 isoform X2 [Bombina bombina]
MSLVQQSQTWFPTSVQVTVLQAKNLKAKGKAGTNDSYAIIQLGKEKFSTTVAEKSQAPVWKEEATFELPLLHIDNQERCTVRVIVMHRALVGMDKFLGQVGLNLWELHQNKNRKKTQWYPLKSKPGKKEKERGQIEVDVQFMRNSMTASMFDLSMKEKSRSPFGKLKDKIKGKRHDGFPDTASAIVPSMNQYDDSDEEVPEVEKKKSKLKNLFSKPGSGLKKNSISQSMSVLPTFPPSSSQRTVLKPADFSSDFNQVSGSPASERRFPHLPVIMTHKRTASADTKQLNQVVSGNKKEGLSFFSGMKSKNDPITRSNLCINGNHVYMEESENKTESSKDNSLTNSPQIVRKTPLYASAENLSSKPVKDTLNISNPPPEKKLPTSGSKESLKSMTLPASQKTKVEEPRSRSPPPTSDAQKDLTEPKKQENKKSSLLSLVTGRKDSPKQTESENSTQISMEESKTVGGSMASEQTDIRSKMTSINPFENEGEEKKPEPLPTSERSTKTYAVKPSGEDDAYATSKLGKDNRTSNTTTFTTSDTPVTSNSQINLDIEGKNDGSSESSSDYEKPSVPVFWRSVSSQNKAESKEVQVVAPFAEKNKGKKTYVKSLLDQIKGKPTSTNLDNVVDEGLVRGVLPILQETSSVYNEPESFLDDKPESAIDRFVESQKSGIFAPHINTNANPRTTSSSTDNEVKTDVSVSQTMKEPPKPAPRAQPFPKKEEPVSELKPVAPKPAPRSAAKINKDTSDPPSFSLVADVTPKTNGNVEQSSRIGTSPIDNNIQLGPTTSKMKMAAPVVEDITYKLDELPVIPENPEGTSDDEQLEMKNKFTDDKKSTIIQPNLEMSPYFTEKSNGVKNYETAFALDQSHEKEVTSDSKSKGASDNHPYWDNSDSLKKTTSSKNKVKENQVNNISSNNQHMPEEFSSTSSIVSSSSLPVSVSLSTDESNTQSAKHLTNPTNDGSDKEENSGKKKLLRAWVSPSETHPIATVQSGGTPSSKPRTHPVKPMNTTQNKSPSSFSMPIKSHENALNNINTKKYDSSDPASAFAQLTHDELIQVILKQKETITKKESQVRELEDYIDNLLVRVMEETPNLLRSGSFLKKAGRV